MGRFIEVGNGYACDDDSRRAGFIAAAQAMSNLYQFKPGLTLAWVSPEYSLPQVLEGIKETIGECPLIGCTVDKPINNQPRSRAVVICILASPYLKIKVGIGHGISENWQLATKRALAEVGSPQEKLQATCNSSDLLIENTKKSFLLAFSPATTGTKTGSMFDVIEVINRQTKNIWPIIGGTVKAENNAVTSQFIGNEIFNDSLILIRVDTNLKFGIAAGQGYLPSMKTAVITRATGYVIDELDGQPAAVTYLNLLDLTVQQVQGQEEQILRQRPIGIGDAFGNYRLVGAVGLTETEGIRCFRRPLVGAKVVIMEYVPELLAKIDAAVIARAKERGRINTPQLAMVFSSAEKSNLLGNDTELSAQLEQAFPGVPKVGFLSAGEQGVMEDGVATHTNFGVTALVLEDELDDSAKGAVEISKLSEKLTNSAMEVKTLYDELATVHHLATTLNSSLSLDDITNDAVDIVRKLLNADGCVLLLKRLTEDGERLYIAGHSGGGEVPLDEEVQDSLCYTSIEEGKGFVVLTQMGLINDSVQARSIIGQPIINQGSSMGLIISYSGQEDFFSGKDLTYLETISYQIGIALKNAYRLHATELKACTDGLTGLFDHNYFLDSLDRSIKTSEEFRQSLALVMIDLDDFKFYNDAFGHSVGDIILRTTAQILKQVTRTGDVIARYGGDEFAIILSNTNLDQAMDIADRIRIKINKTTHLMDELCFLKKLTASIGVATYPEDARNARDLIDAADKAMYTKKREEKDRTGDFFAELEEMATGLDDTERALFDTIKILIGVLDSRDQYTWDHSRETAKLAEKIALRMQLDTEVVAGVRMASLLHDIGKIHVNEEILNKREELNNMDWSLIELHPIVGANLLKPIAGFAPIFPSIYHHHERFDGTGYPDKLSGKDIPLGARIITVADSFNAMTSNRPYRKAMSMEEVLREMDTQRGSQFDPDVLDILGAVIRNGEYAISVE